MPHKGFTFAAAAGSGSAEDQAAAVGEYVKQAAEQIMLGNYYEGGVTLLGTIGQLALGFTGLDAAADLRDV